MAFDSDLRTLLKTMKKVSRKPFEDLRMQARKEGWDEGAPGNPAGTSSLAASEDSPRKDDVTG